MSRELPILFNGEMVRAILDGRKIETRRPVKPQPLMGHETPVIHPPPHDGGWYYPGTPNRPVPFGSPGDLLYVRETWDSMSFYRADYPSGKHPMSDGKWRPSIHMPKRAARIWLRVLEVRVERVREITEVGARNEGIACVPGGYTWGLPGDMKHNAPTHAFRKLWDSIYGDGTVSSPLAWDLNPWVWVCRFEVVSTTGSPA